MEISVIREKQMHVVHAKCHEKAQPTKVEAATVQLSSHFCRRRFPSPSIVATSSPYRQAAKLLFHYVWWLVEIKGKRFIRARPSRKIFRAQRTFFIRLHPLVRYINKCCVILFWINPSGRTQVTRTGNISIPFVSVKKFLFNDRLRTSTLLFKRVRRRS